MKRFFSMAAVLMLCGTASFAQYTNLLENGTSQTVTNAWDTDTIWVGNNTPSNTLNVIDGGTVTSTNVYVGASSNATDNVLSVTGTGSLTVDETLTIGTGTSNAVSVGSGGTISVGNLVINSNNTFNLDADGTFAISTNFNASMDGFDWAAGGHLSVDGDLTGMTTTSNGVYLDGGRDLTVDGGTWTNGNQDLIVGYNDSDSTLAIINGGKVDNADGYIGWGTNTSDNAVSVSGTGSEWRNNGGHLTIAGTNSSLTVSDQAWVYVGEVDASNFVAGSEGGIVVASVNGAELKVDNNSVVSTTGSLVIGGTNPTMGGSVSVSGNSTMSAADLTLNSGGSISLASGGSIADLSSMNVYSNATISGEGAIGFGATDASLSFLGTDYFVDSNIVFSATDGYVNTLSYFDGELDVSEFDPSQFEYFGNLVLSNSDLIGTGVLDSFDNIDMTGGTIAPGGQNIGSIHIDGSFSADGTEYLAQVDNATNDVLSFSDAVDLSDLGLTLAVSGTSPDTLTILSADGGLTNSFYSTNILGRPLLYTVGLQVTNNEVQVVMAEDTSLNLSSALDYAATESVRAGFSGMKNMVFTRTKQLRRNLVSTQHAIPYETYLLTNTNNAPAGAMGPGDQNTIFDMHVWLQQYSGWGDVDRVGASDAFTLNNHGTTIGADKLIGEALAVGLNYTYARTGARATNQDRVDTETYWIGAYGEWVGVEGLYVDALAGYGSSSYDSVRYADNYLGMASYNGKAFGAYADVGQYYYYGDHLALSPYMGLHALSVTVDGHDEIEQAGSKLHVDQVDRNWLDSVIGLKLRHRFDTPVGRFQTTGYAEWSYDFIQDDVYSTLSSGGLSGVETARITPDQTGINTGLGYSWICTDYLEVGIGYNGRFSDNYEEHTGSVMLDIRF